MSLIKWVCVTRRLNLLVGLLTIEFEFIVTLGYQTRLSESKQ